MTRSSTYFSESEKEKVDDVLTALLREGAQKLLYQAIEIEVTSYLSQHADLQDEQGRRQVVRNGYLPVRTLQY